MNNYWRCLVCGKTYDQEGRFCPTCGRIMTLETSENSKKVLLVERTPKAEVKTESKQVAPAKSTNTTTAETKPKKSLAFSKRR